MTDTFPDNDPVALGVLNTVADRLDWPADAIYEWAEGAGSEYFYTLLDSPEAETFFGMLAEDRDEDYLGDYDEHVGPAVDRIEDAYTHNRDLLREGF